MFTKLSKILIKILNLFGLRLSHEAALQFTKFFFVGVISTLVDFALLYTLTEYAGFWYLASATFGFMGGAITSYALNKIWTFRNKEKRIGKQLSIFIGVAISGIIINNALIYTLVEYAGLWYMLAKAISALITLVWNYFTHKHISFNEKLYQRNKILIATGIYPPEIGGPATMLGPLKLALEQRGFLVKVVTYSDKLNYPKDAGVYRIDKNKSGRHLSYFFTLFKWSLWADLLYVTDTYSAGYFARLIKKLSGKKYILRFVGDSAWETSLNNGWTNDFILDFLDKKYEPKIEALKTRRKSILTEADKVIAVSNFMAKISQKIGVINDRISVIPNAVDFGQPLNSMVLNNDFSADGQVIVTACRLTPWKGVDGLIRAMAKLKIKWPKAKLLVLGDGPEMTNLVKLTEELNLTDRVIFKGRVAQPDLLAYLKAADIFVLNSNYEGMSHTLLEAMSLAKPIIASDIEPNRELIKDGDNGFLVEYNNFEKIKDKINLVLSDASLAQNLGKNAFNKSREFSWKQNVESTIKIIEELL